MDEPRVSVGVWLDQRRQPSIGERGANVRTIELEQLPGTEIRYAAVVLDLTPECSDDEDEMYALVENVEEYGDFLPWCGGSALLERDGTRTVARVDIDFKALKKSFVTENQNEPGRSIDIRLKEGPFRHLEGIWKFDTLSESASRVSLDLEFEFSGIALDKLFGPVFSGISKSMVDSFVKRAEQVYGKRKLSFG